MNKYLLRILTMLLVIPAVLLLSTCQEENTSNFTPIDGLVDWERLFVDSFNDLQDVYFVNSSAGWAVGENRTLFSTSSGDLGWSRAPVDFPLEDFNSVFFIDTDIGWLAGNLSESTPKGQIAYTAMGGGYPVQQFVSENPLNALFFSDELNGWAAGEDGILIRTMDGGFNWESIPVSTSDNIYDICFVNENMGWLATANGNIYRTLNAEQWESTPTGITTDLLAIQFIDEENGWACGLNNTILRWEEAEGEMAWKEYTIPVESRSLIWTDIFFVDSQTGWIIGEFGRVYKTADGGVNWTEERSSSSSTLNAIFMVSKEKGWIVGDEGVIMSYSPR